MDRNKKIANEIVMIFRKFKLALICGVIWFVGVSVHNKLITYTFSSKQITWFEAGEILLGYGSVPSEYNKIYEGNGFVRMEISDEGYKKVKMQVLDRLLEKSILSTLKFIPIAFVLLLLLHYITKGIKWTNKYAD